MREVNAKAQLVVAGPASAKGSPVPGSTPRALNPLPQSSSEQCGLYHLNNDAILLILSHLSGTELCRVAQVSRYFHRMVGSDWLWALCVFKEFGFWPLPRTLPEGMTWRRMYRDLHRKYCVPSVLWTGWQPQTGQLRPSAREGHAGALLADRYFVVFGGWSNVWPTLCNDVWAYDTQAGAAGSWVQLRASGQPPPPRYGHAMCPIKGDRLFVFGGMFQGGYGGETDDVHVLSLVGHDQETGLPLLQWEAVTLRGHVVERGYHTVTASLDGSKVYIFGGIRRGRSSRDMTVVDVDDWTATKIDTVLSKKPLTRCKEGEAASPRASAQKDSQWEEDDWMDEDDSEEEEEEEVPVVSPRYGHSCIAVGKYICVFGGANGGNLLRQGTDFVNDLVAYDTKADTWHKIETTGDRPSLALGRCHVGLRVFGNKLLFIGGHLTQRGLLCVLDFDTLKFHTPNICTPPSAPNPATKRLSHVAATVNDKVYIFGGWADGECLGDTVVLDLDCLRFDPDTSPVDPDTFSTDDTPLQEYLYGYRLSGNRSYVIALLERLMRQGQGDDDSDGAEDRGEEEEDEDEDDPDYDPAHPNHV